MKGKLITLSRSEAGRAAAAWRRRGLKVVFTNGVFDILHAGHVMLLRKARALGDVLVLGLNTDASVRRLKGPSRPVNRWADRAAVLTALECVDAVVGFGEDTPALLLSVLRPDVLVKGADYALSEIAGSEHAARTVRIALKKGYSTTSLIRKLGTR
ncbi:MAG: adenylyltransferase/cytidyltransferase family protein [Elusimicrobiota bacterium]|jgi:D-beta-D-heptose 7-phosphate kinase/D-beta-D-heptose 1-phosphate adenosyltransferase